MSLAMLNHGRLVTLIFGPLHLAESPLDVTKNFTFDVIAGILADMRKIFPFEFFHLGGDEVNTDCWKNTTHVKEWYNHMTLSFHVTHRIYFLSNQNHPRRYILSQKNQYVLKPKERLISSQMGSM
ncbi:unnamed protein product [Brassica oleracea]